VNINVHIERLILNGVNIRPGQRHLLQSSVETELTRLLTNGGVSPSFSEGIALPHVFANGIQLAGGNDPVQLGRQIAQSVYGGIKK
jgi:hypothetical protein